MVQHQRVGQIQPAWHLPGWWLVECICGWYTHRPTRQKAKREFHHHVAFLRRQTAERAAPPPAPPP